MVVTQAPNARDHHPTSDLDTAAIRIFDTPLGWMGLRVGDGGIERIVFDCPSPAQAAAILSLAEEADATVRRRIAAGRGRRRQVDVIGLGQRTERLLIDYAAGQRVDFRRLPLDLDGCTEFQVHVIQACRSIRHGSTCSYGQLAERSGSPRAARAVGSVMARNRWPLVVPCHRVVGSNGSLHGFSSRGGLRMKQRLLQLETAGRPC